MNHSQAQVPAWLRPRLRPGVGAPAPSAPPPVPAWAIPASTVPQLGGPATFRSGVLYTMTLWPIPGNAPADPATVLRDLGFTVNSVVQNNDGSSTAVAAGPSSPYMSSSADAMNTVLFSGPGTFPVFAQGATIIGQTSGVQAVVASEYDVPNSRAGVLTTTPYVPAPTQTPPPTGLFIPGENLLEVIPPQAISYDAVPGNTVQAPYEQSGSTLTITFPPGSTNVTWGHSSQGVANGYPPTSSRNAQGNTTVTATLDGNPGTFQVSWQDSSGNPQLFTVSLAGSPTNATNPGATVAYQYGIVLKSPRTGAMLGVTSIASTSTVPIVQPPHFHGPNPPKVPINPPPPPPPPTKTPPIQHGGNPNPTSTTAAATSSNTTLIVAVAAGVVALGALGYWAYKAKVL